MVALDILAITILFLVGIVIATLGSMTGLGGGFLCVPFLIILWGIGREDAVLISLTMILANSTSASISYLKTKMVDLRLAFLLAIGALPGIYIGYLILKVILREQPVVFDLLFSVLLIVMILYIIYTRGIKDEKIDDGDRQIDDQGEENSRMKPVVTIPVAFLSGVTSSLFGIGGGAILMPLQVGFLKMDVKRAIATSMFLIMIITAFRVLVISRAGFDPLIAIPLVFGAVIGAQIGSLLVKKLKGKHLLFILGFFLISIGLYMGIGAIVDLV